VDKFLTLAHALADAAAAAITPYFGAHGAVDTKADASPVTAADRAAEEAMRNMLLREVPEHTIYGEEFGITTRHASGHTPHYTWVLDPIDGTRAFTQGLKEWGTLIALCEDGVPILGLMNQPITGERWLGVRGEKTRYQGAEISLSPKPATLAEAEISTTSASYFTTAQTEAFAALAKQFKRTVLGGDCYAYGLLARGLRDMVVDAGLKPYDILALVPIIEGAGGAISTWENQPVTLARYSTVVAARQKALCQSALVALSTNT
jgi:histidinol phosphatase-like enzyme (inositol monophosphatase family)